MGCLSIYHLAFCPIILGLEDAFLVGPRAECILSDTIIN